MVTLSCLIVVAALFAQIATTTPSSASPKAIDIIFFAIIIRLFMVVLHHTILFVLQVYKKRCQEAADPDESKGTARRDSTPGPAVYIPPDVRLPVTPWDASGHESKAPLKAWSSADGEKMNMGKCQAYLSKGATKMKRERRTCDQIFNVLSICIGMMFDVILSSLYFIAIIAFRNNIINDATNCLY